MSTAGHRRYFRGADLVSMVDVTAGKKSIYHHDHQGTVQSLTDASTGALTDTFASDAWGVQVKRTGTSINRHWYIGGLGAYREADLRRSYARSRYFALPAARWLNAGKLVWKARYVMSATNPLPPPPPTPAFYLGFATQGPEANNACGASDWPVLWTLHPVPKVGEHFGYIIQRVAISGEVESCAGGQIPFPDGCEYYEAWFVHTSANRIIGTLTDDSFSWPGTVAPSKGWYRISGVAYFFEDYHLGQGGIGWQMGGSPCPNGAWKAGQLMWTSGPVPELNDPRLSRVYRHLQMEWSCAGCKPECVCDACEGVSVKPPIGRADRWKCSGNICP